MKLLGLDFETTGLSTSESRVVEIGAAIWDTELPGLVGMIDALVYHPDRPEMSPEAQAAHGLSWDVLEKYGLAPDDAFRSLHNMMMGVDYVVAHNGLNFDRPMGKANAERAGILWVDKPWIDTAQDVPYPASSTSRRLVHLAADHGIMNPFPHRALPDVLTMLQLLSKYADQMDLIVKNATTPTIKVRTTGITFDTRDLPKARRYRWDAAGKFWWKELKEFDLEKEQKEAPFRIEVMTP